MARPAVVFDGVWKKFRRGERHDSLRDLIPSMVGGLIARLAGRASCAKQEFWALQRRLVRGQRRARRSASSVRTAPASRPR